MSLSDLADQDRARAVAASWFTSGRIPHAILLSGAGGTGKRRFALQLAKAMLCSEGDPFSCDHCPTCRKVDSLQHPDFHTAMPLPPRRGKREASPEVLRDAVVEYIGGGATPPSNANIAVEHLRQLQKELSYSPTESPRKVGMIFAAERMHPAGANSLLKILEEPPARVILVLVATAPERLLPTILSRCQRLTLGPISAEGICRQLELEGVVGERLQLAVRMSAGSIHRARQVVGGEFDEMRRLVEEFLAGGAAQEDEVYWGVLDELGGDRGELENFLLICGQYLRDCFLLAHGQVEAVVHMDRCAYLETASATIDAARAALEIDRAAETLANNASPQLVLTDLWRSLRRGGAASTMPPEASLVGVRNR